MDDNAMFLPLSLDPLFVQISPLIRIEYIRIDDQLPRYRYGHGAWSSFKDRFSFRRPKISTIVSGIVSNISPDRWKPPITA
jgi:hypothetical protein